MATIVLELGDCRRGFDKADELPCWLWSVSHMPIRILHVVKQGMIMAVVWRDFASNGQRGNVPYRCDFPWVGWVN
ncbi:hypothetical protein GBA52_004355 [Prunus armeniaca]|nr:hypothetical protein GBA52_004355 [Prunus armeniaca]